MPKVVVWLKIRKHDIENGVFYFNSQVVVWLKIRKHDIAKENNRNYFWLWFD